MADSPFIGPTYPVGSKPTSVARTVNLIPRAIEPGNERQSWVFDDVSGLTLVMQTLQPVVPPHTCTTGPEWEQVVKVNKKSYGMYYLNDRFVSPFLATDGSVTGGVMTSTDGETWTNTATFASLGLGFHITSVAYGNGLWVAYGNASNQIWYSVDCVTFNVAAITNMSKLYEPTAIWFGNGKFVLCANNTYTTIFHSASATGMVAVTTPEDFQCGVYSDAAGLHFAGSADTGKVYSSPDLAVWTLAGTAFASTATVKKIAVNPAGVLVAIDGTTQRSFVSRSTNNGVTWTPSTGLPVLAAYYVDLLYLESQDLWMVTDDDGYTYISTDGGASWTLQSSALNSYLGPNQNWWMAVHPDGFIYAAVPVTNTPSTVAALGTC